VLGLKGELQDYFQKNSTPEFAKCFEDEEWLEKLAYLADIFHHMNQLNKAPEKLFDFKRQDPWN
jgi:hypothetical protein